MKYHLKLRIVLAVIATILLFSAAAYMNTDLFDSLLDNLGEDTAENTEEEAEEDTEEEAEANASGRQRSASRGTSAAEEEEETEAEEETTAAAAYDLTDVSVTLFDIDEFSAVITGVGFIEESGTVTAILTIEAVNKTADQDLEVRIDYEYINGVYSALSDEFSLEAGGSGEVTLSFALFMPEEIGEITDIRLYAEVWEVELPDSGYGWTQSIRELGSSTVHVYPQGEENASVLVRESRDTDVLLLDDDDVVTISYIGYGTDGYYSDLYDVTVPLYIENLTGQDITVEADIITVNGVDVKDYLIWTYFDLEAGTSAYVEFTMDYDYELSEVGITDASEITSMEIRVKTQDSDYHTLTSGTYTLTLQ